MLEITGRKPVLSKRVGVHIEKSVVKMGTDNPAFANGEKDWKIELKSVNILVYLKTADASVKATLGFYEIVTDKGIYQMVFKTLWHNTRR